MMVWNTRDLWTLIMGFLLIVAFIATLFGGFVAGTSTFTPIIRQDTVEWCIRSQIDCKKEYEFYQLKKEVQAMKENRK